VNRHEAVSLPREAGLVIELQHSNLLTLFDYDNPELCLYHPFSVNQPASTLGQCLKAVLKDD